VDENWEGKTNYSEKACPSAILPTTNPALPHLGLKSGCLGGKQATNFLSYGTAALYSKF
jgi:hypothetical protein